MTSLRVLSNALEGDGRGLASDLSCNFFRRVLHQVNNVADELGVAPILIDEHLLVPDTLGTRTYKPELGAALFGLRSTETRRDWPSLSGQMSIAGFLNGLIPSLDLEIRTGRPLVVGGHPVKGEVLLITGEADQVAVRGSSGPPLLSLRRVPLGTPGPLWTREGQDDIVRLGSSHAAVLSDGAWINEWHPEVAANTEVTPDREVSRRILQEAMSALERYAPEYYRWSTLPLHEIMPLKTPGKNAHALTPNSQSFSSWPGHAQMATPSVVYTISVLVHETSHLLFFLCQWTKRIARKGAPPDYSAIKRRNRPVDKVLLSYHAFANVLLALSLFRGTDLDGPELRKEMVHVSKLVDGFTTVLDRNYEENLEQAGRDLYLPLRDRIARAELLSLGRPAPRPEAVAELT